MTRKLELTKIVYFYDFFNLEEIDLNKENLELGCPRQKNIWNVDPKKNNNNKNNNKKLDKMLKSFG